MVGGHWGGKPTSPQLMCPGTVVTHIPLPPSLPQVPLGCSLDLRSKATGPGLRKDQIPGGARAAPRTVNPAEVQPLSCLADAIPPSPHVWPGRGWSWSWSWEGRWGNVPGRECSLFLEVRIALPIFWMRKPRFPEDKRLAKDHSAGGAGARARAKARSRAPASLPLEHLLPWHGPLCFYSWVTLPHHLQEKKQKERRLLLYSKWPPRGHVFPLRLSRYWLSLGPHRL